MEVFNFAQNQTIFSNEPNIATFTQLQKSFQELSVHG